MYVYIHTHNSLDTTLSCVVLYEGVRVEASDSVTCPSDGTAQCLSLLEGNASVRQHTHILTHSLTHTLTHTLTH